MRYRYVLYSLLGLTAAAFAYVALVNLRDVRHKEQYAHNGRRLQRIVEVLQKEQPLSIEAVHDELTRRFGSDALNDAWGHPFEFSVQQDPSGIHHYVIRSLGADRIEGPCVAGSAAGFDPDCDWFTVDGVIQDPG